MGWKQDRIKHLEEKVRELEKDNLIERQRYNTLLKKTAEERDRLSAFILGEAAMFLDNTPATAGAVLDVLNLFAPKPEPLVVSVAPAVEPPSVQPVVEPPIEGTMGVPVVLEAHEPDPKP